MYMSGIKAYVCSIYWYIFLWKQLFKLVKTPDYISPHSAILTCNFGLFMILSSASEPSSILIPSQVTFCPRILDRKAKRKREKKRKPTHLLLAPVGTFSIFLTVNKPSMTRPKTQCLPSRNSAGAVVMKNYWEHQKHFSFLHHYLLRAGGVVNRRLTWHPLVFGPEFACGKVYSHQLPVPHFCLPYHAFAHVPREVHGKKGMGMRNQYI